MPKQLVKKQADEHFVEVSLRIAKNKYPLVSKALKAVMALAGDQVSLAKKTDQKLEQEQKKPRGPKAKTKTTSDARPAKSRRRTPTEDKAPPSPETAALIRDLRTKAGLSQKDLAAKLKISQNQLSLLETRKQRLKPALAKKLGRLFNTPIPMEN